MSSFRLNIDLLPINVVLYKKQHNDYICVAFNFLEKEDQIPDCKELVGRSIRIFFPEARESGLLDVMDRVILSGCSEVFNTSPCFVNQNNGTQKNEIVRIEESLLAIFIECGNANFNDGKGLQLAKELNEAEVLLEHQKKMFQHIMENSESISVQGYNENHEVIYWNKASEKLYGYSADEAFGKTLESLIIPAYMRQSVHDAIEAWLYHGVFVPSGELTLVNKEGEDVNVFSQHIMIQVDVKHLEMYCVDIDLKEVKHLQKELLTQRNFLRTIFDVIPDLIWLQDIEGKYLACNTKFECFIGATEDEIVGKESTDFINNELATLIDSHDIEELTSKMSYIKNGYLFFADNSQKGLFETVKTPMIDTDGNLVGILGVARDITEHKAREQQLKTYAHFDLLTGLANRTLFMDRLTQLTKQRKSDGFVSAVLFIDLDHFKEINDTKGHSVGDQVLVLVANRLKSLVRKGDTLARFGGDEFTILLGQITSSLEVCAVAVKILNRLREPLIIDEHQFYVTTSIGITVFPEDGIEPESLLRYADIAMYKAKSSGRDCYELYTKALSKQTSDRVLLENNLRQAINNNEFVLYYQPQIDVLRKEVIGVEALIRWNDPQQGLVSPYKFISAAEISGQIVEIGRWVIYQAMLDMGKWREKGLNVGTISINLSVKQLNDKTLIPMIKSTLKKTKCNPNWVEFEITEGYAMNDPEQAIVLLEEISQLGCKVSIDDFGTGYSSLAYLKRLPIKKLKIDQSFIRDVPGDSDDEAIVKAVILIAQSMKLEVIAEGVEDEAQQVFLLEQGCHFSQGYLYAKPMPIDHFEKYLQQGVV